MVLDNFVVYYVKEPTITKEDIDDLQIKVQGRIRRPPTPFFLFLRRNSQLIRKQQPGLKGGAEVSRLLGLIWRSLPTPLRNLYERCTMQLRVIHAQLFPDFEYVEKKIKQEEDEVNPAENATFGWMYLTPLDHDGKNTKPIATKQNDTSNEPLLRRVPETLNHLATELSKNTPHSLMPKHIPSPDINKNEELPVSFSFSTPSQAEETQPSEDFDVKPPRNSRLEALEANNSSSKMLYTSDSALMPNSTSFSQLKLTGHCIFSSYINSSSSLPLNIMDPGEGKSSNSKKRKASQFNNELEVLIANTKSKKPKLSSTVLSSSSSLSETSFPCCKSSCDELQLFNNRVCPSNVGFSNSVLKPTNSRGTQLTRSSDNEEPLTSSVHSITFSPAIDVNADSEAGKQYNQWLQLLFNKRSPVDLPISPLYSNLCTPFRNESSPDNSFYPEEIMLSLEEISSLKSYYNSSNDARRVSSEFADQQLGTVTENLPSATELSSLGNFRRGSTLQLQDYSEQNMSTNTQIQTKSFNCYVSRSVIPTSSPNSLQQKATTSDSGEFGKTTSPDGFYGGFQTYSPAEYGNFVTSLKHNGNGYSPFPGDTPPAVVVTPTYIIGTTSTNVTNTLPAGVIDDAPIVINTPPTKDY